MLRARAIKYAVELFARSKKPDGSIILEHLFAIGYSITWEELAKI